MTMIWCYSQLPVIISLFVVASCYRRYPITQIQPEQIHLSLGKDPSEMMVTWVTMNATKTPKVEYNLIGDEKFSLVQIGFSTIFIDGGKEKRTMFMNRVLLRNLKPGRAYGYHCGSDDGWSALFSFRTLKEGQDWDPKFVIYGDLGNANGLSIPYIQREAQRGEYDVTIHVGDFAYNMDWDNARVGDDFMNQIEPIAAYVPYQAIVGNHEEAYNFSNYDNRFSMIDAETGMINNHFYSFNVGPVHFVSFSTEFYFFLNYGWSQLMRQYNWLEQDLKLASSPENRAKRPWIVALGHRPMYCSTDDRDDCSFKESIIRKGFPIIHSWGLEDMFYEYGVDLQFWAHEHTYERMWPVYDRKVYNGSYNEPYTNPGAPVHVITGSAGMAGGVDPFVPNPAPWSAVRISDYGYTKMQVFNHTHLKVEQVSAVKEGEVVDSFTIIKNFHGRYR